MLRRPLRLFHSVSIYSRSSRLEGGGGTSSSSTNSLPWVGLFPSLKHALNSSIVSTGGSSRSRTSLLFARDIEVAMMKGWVPFIQSGVVCNSPKRNQTQSFSRMVQILNMIAIKLTFLQHGLIFFIFTLHTVFYII